MKRIALEQACRGGDQKSCQDLAKMGRAQPQEQQPGQPPQNPGQQQPGPKPQKPGQASHQSAGQLNDSGPFQPPAGSKIEEKIMAPLQERAQFDVSPHGLHVATTETAGSRAVVYYDGEAGPKFDEIITQPTGTHAAFSPDGERYAYCARAGDQYVVVLDGKELARSSEANSGRFDEESCHLGFTSNSKHVFWTSRVVLDTQRGKNFTRFWFDGRPSPTGTAGGVSFSPDGDHYAYILTIQDPYHEDRYALMIDGKIAPYLAGTPQWSGDSKHLYTQQHVGSGNNQAIDLLLDGKPIARAFNFQLYVAPTGNMTVAIVSGGSRSAPITFLAVNGKLVPGTEIGAPGGFDEVVFSPDGKHYAALCRRTQTKLLIVDGKKQTEYQEIKHVTFTADSSKVVYVAAANNKSFVVLGDQESDAYGFTSLATELLIAPVGNRVGALVSDDNYSRLLYLDGKTIRTGLKGISQLRFTSDGTHYAYIAVDSGNGTRLAVDGVAQSASSFGPPNMAIYAKYAISPDGKHFAHLGFPPQLTGDDERVLFLDGKYIAINHGMNTSFLTFSPDSKHVAWFQAIPSTYDFRVYIDGKPVAQMEATSGVGINNDTIKWFEFQPDGTLLVLGQDENSLKRISITPSDATSLATMLGGSNAVAANH
jgi:WD40 repeat protein